MLTAINDVRQSDHLRVIHPLHRASSHQAPLVWVEGSGAVLRDINGKQYIDGLSGLWNVHIGHGRHELAHVAMEQMSRLAFCSSFAGSTNPLVTKLAARLSELVYPALTGFFFTSSGAEASETAFKMARYYWRRQGYAEKIKIIGLTRGYHGLTLAAMSATGLNRFWPMFEPRVPGFLHIESPYPYRFTFDKEAASPGVAAADLLEAAILREGPDSVAAFIVEPVQGAGGVIVPPADYFQQIRAICDRYNVLLISDEIITGFGRTGRWFGLEHWSVQPDMMLFAKGITSGYMPLGGVGVSAAIHDAIQQAPADQRFLHAFTSSGHPTCCAVALANIDIIEREGLVDRAQELGAYLLQQLQTLLPLSHVGDIRGLGLMAAVECVADTATRQPFPPEAGVTGRLMRGLLRHGLFTRVNNDTIYLAPPLVTTKAQIDQIVEGVADAVESIANS